jgi:hypothetical protein
MGIMERWTQRVRQDRWGSVWEREKLWEAVEARVGGFGPKRRYQVIAGCPDANAFVWEREWESFAALEAAYARLLADPEAQSLAHSSPEVFESGGRREYYAVWDPDRAPAS